MPSKTRTAFQAVALSEYEDTIDYERQFYTPTATKPPLLIALLCSVLACIAVLQVAAFKSVEGVAAATGSSSPSVFKRQGVSSSSSTFSSTTFALAETSDLDTSSASTYSIVPTASAAVSAYLITSSSAETVTYSTPDSTAYLDTSTSSILGAITSSQVPASYLDTSTAPVVKSSTTTSSVPLVASTPLAIGTSAAPSAAYLDSSSDSIDSTLTVPSTAANAYITISSPTEPIVSSSAAPKSYLNPSTPPVVSSITSTVTSGSYLDTSTGAYLITSTPPNPYVTTTSSAETAKTIALSTSVSAYVDTSTPPEDAQSTSSSHEPTTKVTTVSTAYVDTSSPSSHTSPTAHLSPSSINPPGQTAHINTSTPPAGKSGATIIPLDSTRSSSGRPPTTTPVSTTTAHLASPTPSAATISTTGISASLSASKTETTVTGSPRISHSTILASVVFGTSGSATRPSPADAPNSHSSDGAALDTSTSSESFSITTWTLSGTVFTGVSEPITLTPGIEPMLSTFSSNVLPTAVSTENSASSSSNIPGVVDITKLPNTDRVIVGTFTMTKYYTATYLCPCVVVLLKCVWGVIFASTKMVEPFHQLAKPGGADVRISLLADYLSSGLSTTALSSLFTARPVMLTAVVISGLLAAMAPVASEAMSIQPSGTCLFSDGIYHRCAPVWILSTPCIRLLQALLSVVFSLILTYLFLNFRRQSGIFSDPSSIASVASLLGNEDFIQELRDLPINTSKKDIKRLFAGNRYTLATFTREGGKIAYGIVRADEGRWHDGYHVANIQDTSPVREEKTHSQKSACLYDILLFLLSGGILTVILFYYEDGKGDGFNNFFNSGTFGPRFILTSAATGLDYLWKRLEREVRMMQPFRTLHKSSGSKATTEALLSHTASTMHTSFTTALWRGDLFLALVSLVAILADVLIIAVVGVPFSYGQVYIAFQISMWLSASILVLMILTSLAVMLYWRRSNPKGMPRQPNTLLAVALYLCASQVTEQLVPLSMTSQSHRDQAVRSWRGRYWFGHALGVDGRARWLVDQDEGGFEPSRKRGRVGDRFE